jgi:hypothetical protein
MGMPSMSTGKYNRTRAVAAARGVSYSVSPVVSYRKNEV